MNSDESKEEEESEAKKLLPKKKGTRKRVFPKEFKERIPGTRKIAEMKIEGVLTY